MEKINRLIEEALTNPVQVKDCNCGCGGCQEKKNAPILKESKVSDLLSEGMRYHIDNKISLSECEYEYGSESHLLLIREARKLYSRGIINVSEADKQLLETDLGHFGKYEGEMVPLDLPMLDESYYEVVADLGDKKSKENLDSFEELQDFMSKMIDRNAISVDVTKFDKDEKNTIKYNWTGDKWEKVLKPMLNESELEEAEYQGRKVELNKPMAGDVKKFKVYVKNPKGNVVKVNFGQKGVKIKKSNPERRKSFRARHNCDNPGPKTKARYWSCRAW